MKKKKYSKEVTSPEQETLRELVEIKGFLSIANAFGFDSTATVERWAADGIPVTMRGIVGLSLNQMKETES